MATKFLTTTIFLLLVLTFLPSCDPVYHLYIVNESQDVANIQVGYYIESSVDSLKSSTDSISTYKARTSQSLDSRIKVLQEDDNHYSFHLKPKETALLEPLSIGLAINQVIKVSDEKIDTVFFTANKYQMDSLRKTKTLSRTGMFTFVIRLK